MYNANRITIDGPLFDESRTYFDSMLQKLLKQMEKNEASEADITLKVKVRLNNVAIPNDKGTSDIVKIPEVKYAVTTQVPVKDSIDGNVVSEKALVYDEYEKKFVLKAVPVNGQMNLEDYMDDEEGADCRPERMALNGGEEAEAKAPKEAFTGKEGEEVPEEVPEEVDPEIGELLYFPEDLEDGQEDGQAGPMAAETGPSEDFPAADSEEFDEFEKMFSEAKMKAGDTAEGSGDDDGYQVGQYDYAFPDVDDFA